MLSTDLSIPKAEHDFFFDFPNLNIPGDCMPLTYQTYDMSQTVSNSGFHIYRAVTLQKLWDFSLSKFYFCFTLLTFNLLSGNKMLPLASIFISLRPFIFFLYPDWDFTWWNTNFLQYIAPVLSPLLKFSWYPLVPRSLKKDYIFYYFFCVSKDCITEFWMLPFYYQNPLN